MVCDANLVGETKVVRTFVSTKLGSLVSDFRLTHLGVEQATRSTDSHGNPAITNSRLKLMRKS